MAGVSGIVDGTHVNRQSTGQVSRGTMGHAGPTTANMPRSFMEGLQAAAAIRSDVVDHFSDTLRYTRNPAEQGALVGAAHAALRPSRPDDSTWYWPEPQYTVSESVASLRRSALESLRQYLRGRRPTDDGVREYLRGSTLTASDQNAVFTQWQQERAEQSRYVYQPGRRQNNW